MNVTIIGTGFVGVISAAVFASLDNKVIGLDIDEQKIDLLRQGQVPFYEPGLKNLLLEQQKTKNLIFTTDYETAIKDADVIMIAVGTPSKPDGNANLKYLFAACKSLAPYLKGQAIVAVKSTVPPGTLDQVKQIIDKNTDVNYYTASLPEFLKEGSAVQDTLHPDRVVIGATDDYVFNKLEKLHKPLGAPILKMEPNSAQMAKYTANAYLATRITFINQIANLCEINGADVEEVIQGIGLDDRIGQHYWYPGFGYGGSCFPKDVKKLAAYSRDVGEEDNLLNKINQINQNRIPKLLKQFKQQIGDWADKKTAVLGLSFKPNTDDTREAPAVKVIPILLEKGAVIKGYDPTAQWLPQDNLDRYTQVETIEQAVQDADIIMALIEWPQITSFDLTKIKQNKKKWLIDARNQFNPGEVKKLGFNYIGIGRN